MWYLLSIVFDFPTLPLYDSIMEALAIVSLDLFRLGPPPYPLSAGGRGFPGIFLFGKWQQPAPNTKTPRFPFWAGSCPSAASSKPLFFPAP